MAKKLIDEEKTMLAASKNRLQVLEEIANIEEEIAKKKEDGLDFDIELIKKLETQQKILSKIDKYSQKISGALKEQFDTYSDLETSIGSMSSLQDDLKNTLKDSVKYGIEFSKSLDMSGAIQAPNKVGFMEINRLMGDISLATSELSQLNEEDATGRLLKNTEINSLQEQMLKTITAMSDKMGTMNDIEKSLLQNAKKHNDSLTKATDMASKFSRISKDTKEVYEELNSDLESLQKTFKKIAITTQIFFSSFKNTAGLTLMYVGSIFDEFVDISKQIGGSVLQMTGFKIQAFAISKILGEDAGQAVISLAEKLGNANDVSVGMGINVGVMANRLGVSGDEAAQLVNQFGNLSGLSNSTALNTMEATSQLAMANGVAPANVMKDIAENTEFFALYSKNGGANIAQAAIEARRLGVDLATASKISDNLLDYQTSVASEMEASVLLGRNLNLSRARELAYAGDSAGAMKEALNAAGGIDAFNKMDVFQKRAVAEAIGVSVTELQQMEANQKRANTSAGKLEGVFNSITSTITEVGTGVGGTLLKGMGGVLAFTGEWSKTLTNIKEGPLGGIYNWVSNIGKKMFSLPTEKLTQLTDSTDVTKNVSDKVKPKRGRPPKVKSMLDSIGNPGQMLAAAGAMIAFASAILILSYAFQNFSNVSWDGFMMGIGAMGAMVLAMKLLIPILGAMSASAEVLVPAIGIMLALGAAIGLIGLGINLAATGMATFVQSLSNLNGNMLKGFGDGMKSMAAGAIELAAALIPLTIIGTIALPILVGIGEVADKLGFNAGGENDLLLEEIKGLRHDIQTQPIMVQLDGRQLYISNLRQGKNKSN